MALYMVIEHFKNGDGTAVYRRFAERGRMAPDGVTYVASWVNEDITCCYQVMEADSRRQLDEWIANWSDIVDFEIVPVLTSAEAARRMASRPADSKEL